MVVASLLLLANFASNQDVVPFGKTDQEILKMGRKGWLLYADNHIGGEALGKMGDSRAFYAEVLGERNARLFKRLNRKRSKALRQALEAMDSTGISLLNESAKCLGTTNTIMLLRPESEIDVESMFYKFVTENSRSDQNVNQSTITGLLNEWVSRQLILARDGGFMYGERYVQDAMTEANRSVVRACRAIKNLPRSEQASCYALLAGWLKPESAGN